MKLFVFLFIIIFKIGKWSTNANDNIPVVHNHDRQLRLHVGERLRLECPIGNSDVRQSASGRNSASVSQYLDEDSVSLLDVMYQWSIRDVPDYSLSMHPRFRFTDNGRVLEITDPVSKEDAGIYRCSGVTGFGRKEAVFDVYITDTNDDLLCAATEGRVVDPRQMLCFTDPNMRTSKVTTIDAMVGTRIEMNCEASGMQPIKHLWFMGASVADWITGGQGVRGPKLKIEKVGREHIGHYTCQVKNPIGTLNYTFRVTVTDPPYAIPTIIGGLSNQTLLGGTGGILTCHIKCSCTEPIIQWLKRVEKHELKAYRDAGKSIVPLPTPRESEANELYVTLEKSVDAPAVMEATTQIRQNEVGHLGRNIDFIEIQNSAEISDDRWSNGMPEKAEDLIFVSRLRLRGPVNPEQHSGKYVVMTMSRANLKSIDYGVVFVTITQPFSPSSHTILVYFVIPIFLVLLVLISAGYFFWTRRGRKSTLDTYRSSHTTFNHNSIFLPALKNCSRRELTAYHNMKNEKLPPNNSSISTRSNGDASRSNLNMTSTNKETINGSDRSSVSKTLNSSLTDNNMMPALITTAPAYTQYPAQNRIFPNSQFDPRNTLQNRHTLQNEYLSNQSVQNAQQALNTTASFYYSGIPLSQHSLGYVHHQTYWPNPVPSVATEMSFEQYSALGPTDAESSHSTNQYTSPIQDFPIGLNSKNSANAHCSPCKPSQ